MKLVFDELAKKELFTEIEHYELEVPGLGQKFQDEIKRVLLKKYLKSIHLKMNIF